MNNIFRVLRSFAIALLLSGVGANAMAAGYYAQAGKIYNVNGQEIQIRGISHFGFNAEILQPQYLWEMGWKEQIAQIKSLGFNAIRVPFVPDTLYNTTPVNQLSYVDPNRNPELIGKTPLQVLDLWMAEANRQGLYVMLDFHSVSKQRMYPTWFVSNPADYNLIYNNQAYTPDHWKRDLKFVATRYAHLPYFFAIDLFNEPNGMVRWSTGSSGMTNPAYFWKDAAESASAAVLTANPNLLIFVQGITGNYDGRERSDIPMNWGENLQPQAYQPLNIPLNKLVLSPHTYGPDVYVKSSFSTPNFPANLAADWQTLFGQFSAVHPVVVGEWGGKYGQGTGGQADVVWQNALVDYLQSKGIRNSFYWCYTPNSGDTGGILYHDSADNSILKVREDKMTLLRRHWGTPPPGSTNPPAAALTVFGDAMAPQWAISPWSATSAIQSQFVKSGTGAIKIDANTWGGINLDSRDANWVWFDQPGNRYTHLRFDVSAGPTVGAAMNTLQASLDLGWGLSVKLSDYVTSFAPNAWYRVEIPLARMNPNSVNFRRLQFQNNSQSNLTFYIDNVELVNTTTNPNTPTTRLDNQAIIFQFT